MTNLSGRYVLVTGGTEGLGLRIVSEFNARGVACLIVARSAVPVESPNAWSRQQVPENKFFQGDICDIGFLNNLAEEMIESQTQLIGVVHCAAILGEIGSIDNISIDSWNETININLTGTFNVLKLSVLIFNSQGFGNFVALSGGGATDPRPRMLAYAASKTAVVRLIESVAGDNAQNGLTFNCVSPGVLPTRMNLEALQKGTGILSDDYLAKVADVFDDSKEASSSFKEPVDLIVRLITGEFPKVTGKLISAVWDEWRNLPAILAESDRPELFTLRRISP